MRVLLANPPTRINIDDKNEYFYVKAGSRWPHSYIKKKSKRILYPCFPFYLAYTAALLEEEGIDVQVLDFAALNHTKEEFVNSAVNKKPDVILFETSTLTIEHDLNLARILKEKISAKIVLSGTHVTVFPKEVLKNEYVNFILLREYELNFLELVRRLRDGKDLKNVEGLAYKSNGKIIVNNITNLTDLNRLPFPARHLFPTNRYNNLDLYWDGFCQYKPAIQMHTSRGCPFKCNFCLWNQVMYNNGKYRTFSAKRVIDEMEHCIEKYGAREIYFDDDSFTTSKQHVLSICREIKERGLDIKWSCMGDAMVTDKEMIDVMADAGCIGMKFGVETGSYEILKEIGKPINLERVRRVAKWCTKRGIKTHATFTFGSIGETKETIAKTLKFAKELDTDSVQFSITTPFPGTRFYEEVKKKGLLLANKWGEFDGSSSSVVKFQNISSEEVKKLCSVAVREWILLKIRRPTWVLRQLKLSLRILGGQGLNGIYSKCALVLRYLIG